MSAIPAGAKAKVRRIAHDHHRIAYINHDIDDAVRAGIIRENDIPQHLRKRLGDARQAH